MGWPVAGDDQHCYRWLQGGHGVCGTGAGLGGLLLWRLAAVAVLRAEPQLIQRV